MLAQDLRFAVRQWCQAPGFAGMAIATLALAVGIATAMFSVIDAAVLQPLPYSDPDRIAYLQPFSPQGYISPASYPEYLELRRANRTLQALAGASTWQTPKFEEGDSAAAGASPVVTVEGSDNFFEVFGARPVLGRTFAPGEDQPGRNRVAVLSYQVWQQNFGGRGDVLGASVRMGGAWYAVIGVMPADFRYPIQMTNAVYVPLAPSKELAETRDHWLPLVARLKPGVSFRQAELDLKQLEDEIGRAHPDENGRRFEAIPMAQSILGGAGAPLRVLTLAVLGVLAIGCVNVAGLLLAHGVRREHELGLRLAVGATRVRVIRQMLTESALLAIVGAGGGVFLAGALLRAMKPLLLRALARGADLALNPPVLLAAILVALIGALAAGAFPALRSAHLEPYRALRSGENTASTSRAHRRLRGGFIVAQIALSLVLLVVAGLLLRTLYNLRHTNLGFRTDHLLTGVVNLPMPRYRDRDPMKAFYQPLLDGIGAIPGVEAAGIIQDFPVVNWGWNSDVQIAGHPPAAPDVEQLAEIRVATPGYFQALGIGLVRGRMLDPSIDVPNAPPACVVNQAFVKKFFASEEDPIGQHMTGDPPVTIVGVVRDVRQDLRQPPLAEWDIPATQVPPGAMSGMAFASMNLVVRSRLAPESTLPALRSVMKKLDPDVSLSRVRNMPEVIADTLVFERLQSWLFGIFAGLALLLAAAGIYGLISHEVELSTREIGIRVALGSTRRQVLAGTLRRIAYLALLGIALGWAAALALRKVIAAVVEIHVGHDYLLLAGLTAILAAVGLLASLYPACRAAAIEPMEALRME
jgi:predicted permease